MTDIAELGFEVDSGPLRVGTAALRDMSKSARDAAKSVGFANLQFQSTAKAIKPVTGATAQASRGLRKMKDDADKNSKGLGLMGRRAGQAGVQVQQLVGQVAAGQQPMLALSQQAADLGIVLGAPMIGVLVSLGATLGGVIWSAFNSAGEAAESYADSIREAVEESENLNEIQKLLEMRSLRNAIQEQEKLVSDLTDEIDHQTDSFLALREAVPDEPWYASRDRDLANEIFELNLELAGSYRTEAEVLAELRTRLDELMTGRMGARKEAEKQAETVTDLIESLQQEADELGKTERQVALLTATNNKATPAQIALINSIYDDIEAHEEQQEAIKRSEEVLRGYIKSVEATATAEAKLRAGREASIDAQLQAIDQQIGATIESLKTEEQLADEWYQESLNNLMAANEQELSIIGGFNAAKLALEEQYQERKKEIAAEANQEYSALSNESVQAYAGATSAALGLFKQFADNRIADEQRALNATENATEEEIAARNKAAKKAFEDGKNLQLAMVGVNTAAAIMNELATNPNPFAKWANVAAIALTGATQASAISSSTFGGLSTPSTPTAPANEPGGPMGGGGTQNIVTVNFTGATSKDDIANAMRELFEDDFIAFDSDSAQNQVVVNG